MKASQKKPDNIEELSSQLESLRREVAFMKKMLDKGTAITMSSNRANIDLRNELEQKRRGFTLMSELTDYIGKSLDFTEVFSSIVQRINSILMMHKTAVLFPVEYGKFKVYNLYGYTDEDMRSVPQTPLTIDQELVNNNYTAIASDDKTLEKYPILVKALKIPYFISAPVVFNNVVKAIIVTGKTVIGITYNEPLGQSDLETLQAVCAYTANLMTAAEVAESDYRNKIMLDAMPMCCTFWDSRFNCVDCNDAARRLFGLNSAEEFLTRFPELSPPRQPNGMESIPLLHEKITETFNNGFSRFEWLHQKLDGEKIPSDITFVRGKYHGSDIVVGYTHDLREQKAMLAEIHKNEAELLKARNIAEDNARVKSDFLANMSHEIRTPMNAILGMLYLVGETNLDQKQQDYISQAQESTRLLLRILNDILDISKIDAGKMTLERTSFSLRKLIDNTYHLIVNQAQEKGLEFTSVVDDNVADALEGDPLRIEQILLNLIGNGIKFTENGFVKLNISRKLDEKDNTTLQFTIADSGIGMNSMQLNKLFKPFSQADTSTTRKYGGTGLGLAISRSLIKLMKGDITCESVPGIGTRFIFSIPFVKGIVKKTETGTEQSAHEDLNGLKGLHLLLAEDNEINQMIAVEILKAKGIIVETANNGIEALNAAMKNDYDMILMDIQMPQMDGLEATRRIRRLDKYKHVPIIAMTAHAMAEDQKLSLASGMNDHITKPIQPDLLYATIAKWSRQKA